MVISFQYVYAFLAKTYRGPPYTSSFCMPACSWLAVSHVLFVDKLGVLGLALPEACLGGLHAIYPLLKRFGAAHMDASVLKLKVSVSSG